MKITAKYLKALQQADDPTARVSRPLTLVWADLEAASGLHGHCEAQVPLSYPAPSIRGARIRRTAIIQVIPRVGPAGFRYRVTFHLKDALGQRYDLPQTYPTVNRARGAAKAELDSVIELLLSLEQSQPVPR